MFCPCAERPFSLSKDEAKYRALSLQLLPLLQVHLHPLHLPVPMLVLVAVLMAAVDTLSHSCGFPGPGSASEPLTPKCPAISCHLSSEVILISFSGKRAL